MTEHHLTEAERNAFLHTQGYLEIPRALSDEQVDDLVAAVDRHAARFVEPIGWGMVNAADILGLDDAFLELIDCPKILPKICDLLGWNIWVYHTHMNVNPPFPAGAWTPGNPFMYAWHRDGGVMQLPTDDAPPLSIKVGFYLTDVDERGGPTFIVEGSHLESALPEPTSLPASARPMVARRGTAVIFGNRVVHSGLSPNTSTVTRKAVFVAYAYRWIQRMDRQSVAHLAGETNPVRQQLLGLSSTYLANGRSGRFYPTDQDVPLRRAMAES